jgi:large subunit ribosomal protein L16
MNLLPNKTKYRKSQKNGKKLKGVASSGYSIVFGTYALKLMSSGRLRSRHIEAARKCISRTMERKGKMWIRLFPQIPVTGKPAQVRMGSGKGSVDYWMCKIFPGMILFEVDGVSEEIAVSALNKAATKLPFKTKIVKLI